MRVILQRSKAASVTVEGQRTGAIEFGFVALVGVTHTDTLDDVRYVVDKVAHLRVFQDDAGKMNHSLLDVGGQLLSISQFTLYGDVRKGRRPNFMAAAKPDAARELYQSFNMMLREKGIEVAEGIFGAMMDVQLVNHGPVTIIIDSDDK